MLLLRLVQLNAIESNKNMNQATNSWNVKVVENISSVERRTLPENKKFVIRTYLSK